MSLVVFEVMSGWEGSGRFQLSLRFVRVGPGRVPVVFQVRSVRVLVVFQVRPYRVVSEVR